MAIPPLKHVIDGNNIAAAINTTQVVQIAVGTVNPNSYTTQAQCRNGSLIKKLTIQLDIVSTTPSATVANAINTIDWYVWFNIGGAQARPNPNAVNSSVLKNQIFHQDGTLVCNYIATSVGGIPVWKNSWRIEINVPKSLQQLNENDVIELCYIGSDTAASAGVKYRIIYKEIFP